MSTDWMFRGTFECPVDKWGRFTIPSRIRRHLSGSLICFAEIGEGAYLCLYDLPRFMGSLVDVRRIDADKAARASAGYFVSGRPSTLAIDPRGRVRVPAHLLRRVAIRRDAVLIGCGEYLELWALGAWEDWLRNPPPEQPKLGLE